MTGRLLLQKIVTRSPLPMGATESTPPNATTDFNPLEAEPLIDNSPALSDSELALILQNKVPSLPIKYWQTLNNKFPSKNKTCAKFPTLWDISFNNVYWQTLKTTNGTFHLYGAYYDNRTLVAMKPVVRMLGMINRLEPKIKTYCQFWFGGLKEPIFAKVFEYKFVWYKKWGNYKNGLFQPYLVSCQIPVGFRHMVPESVSLVEKPCDMAVTNLRVINNKPENGVKGEFAVCVKGLDFLNEDLSVRLVEWIETLHHLGAEKIFLYELEVHPNITKVLNYYQEKGIVEVTPITLPGYQPNIPGLIHMYLKNKLTNKRQNELIPYNDCLYKNMYRYKYIAVLDTDEVIMPKAKNILWKDLMQNVLAKALAVKNVERASYNVRNVYFFDSIASQESSSHNHFKDMPQFMHMFQHVYRAKNYTKPGAYIKCFHNPERVLTLHNHFPLACLGGSCSSYPIGTEDAQLQHYRADCVKTLRKSCAQYKNATILDDTIWRHKDPVISRVTDSLYQLGFFDQSTGSGSRLTKPPSSVVRRR